MQMGVGASRFAIEAREAVMAFGAGFFAIVATDAELFIDQKRVGGFAKALLDQKLRHFAVHIDHAAELFLLFLDEVVDLAPHLHAGGSPHGGGRKLVQSIRHGQHHSVVFNGERQDAGRAQEARCEALGKQRLLRQGGRLE